MEIINKGNLTLGNPKLINTKIEFKGSGNILFCEDNVTIKNSVIRFEGDNSVVYLSSNKYIYYFDITIIHDSVLFFGKNNYINKKMHIILTEQKHMLVGKDCLFAINCWFRTSDPHLLYDVQSKKRINESKSIFVGDHCWFGQDVLVLKNTMIGSGCILGARTVISGKELGSNKIYAGVPAKCVKENVFHIKESVRMYKKEQTINSREFKKNESNYIYTYDNKTFDLHKILMEIDKIDFSMERVKYIEKVLVDTDRKEFKNRFYIFTEEKKKRLNVFKKIKNKL